MHHRRHIMKMRRMAMRRGNGPRFGGHGRRGMIQGFLAENPDIAERLARYGADRLRADGWQDDEIRDHFDHMAERGLLSDLDIDTILD
jgi:hypothetical protein